MIGVLALQGGFAEHLSVLKQLGVECREVRLPEELEGLTGLILPGGESTVMLRFINQFGLRKPLQDLARRADFPIYGTCAGLIALAQEVDSLPTSPLSLLDISVRRNAYGRQAASFITQVEVKGLGAVPAHFIRAPQIVRVGAKVDVLAEHQDQVVLVRQGNIWGSTFHPELAPTTLLHKMIFKC